MHLGCLTIKRIKNEGENDGWFCKMRTKMSQQFKISSSSLREHFFVLVIILFVFWVVLSGKFDAKHLIIGFVTALVVAWATFNLLTLPSAEYDGKYYMAFDFPVIGFLFYVPWLLWEVVKANIEVALIILNPKMPIQPQIVEFKKPMTNPIAHVLLANSITLTPGTITVDVQDGLYTVHAITDSGALSLAPKEGEGEMPVRVARLFSEQDTLQGGEMIDV